MGQTYIKGLIEPAHRQVTGLKFPYLDKAADGYVREPGDAGGDPGESSLSF